MWAYRVLPAVALLSASLVSPADGIDWKRGRLAHLTPLIGTYDYAEIFADTDVATSLADVLPPATLPLVHENLQVAAPVDFISGHLVLSGNKPRHGGEEMAWVWISVYDASARVILMHNGTLHLFAAAERYEHLPVALRAQVAAPPLASLYRLPANVCWVRTQAQAEGIELCNGRRRE